MLSSNGPKVCFTILLLIWDTQQQPTMIQNFAGLISRPYMGWNSPESNLQTDFDNFCKNTKKVCFSQKRTPYTSIRSHKCYSASCMPWLWFLISVLADNLKKNIVTFNLRKKHWLTVKSQICLPASKFAFSRTWPWSIMNLEIYKVLLNWCKYKKINKNKKKQKK